MNATWRNVDWRMKRTDCWYKVRLVPRLVEDVKLLLAGYEPRTDLFCLDASLQC